MTTEAPNRSAVDDALNREFSEYAEGLPALLELLDAGVPVPFIAHYRRDRVGELSEQQIREIRNRRRELLALDGRRSEIQESLTSQGLLTDEVRKNLNRARTLAAIEDVVRPFRDDATAEAGDLDEKFGPLAAAILEGGAGLTPGDLAAPFVSEERGIPDAEAAIEGAIRVLASRIAADAEMRSRLLRLALERGKLRSAVKSEGDSLAKYATYHDFVQPVKSLPSHRVLAILRGEKEGALDVSLDLDRDQVLALIEEQHPVPEEHPARDLLAKARAVAWDEVLAPELTREVIDSVKVRADDEAVRIFARNLEQLLLMPPAGQKVVMGVEPGVRRGCKIAVVQADGRFVGHASLFPFPPREKVEAAKKTIADFCRHHKVEMIGIGSGPGCREVERFFRETIRAEEGIDVRIALVNEAGVAAYATGEKAKTEFPKLDPRVRSAITVARRLQDPLGELVKLEPKAIGVGPYQRDVDQARLDEVLADVVETCVAKVGVDVNRADAEVLCHVPGIGPERAEALVRWRQENGPVRSREHLKEAPAMDDASWHFASGFLRVEDGEHALDRTAIHPECYELVESMAGKLGLEPGEILGNGRALAGLDPMGFVGDRFGPSTVKAVFEELENPGRDPRGVFELPAFREDLQSIDDLKEGMSLEGIVTNIASFGAFVDVGVDQEGLIHVSELSDGFVKDPGGVVSVGQKVTVRVIGIDRDRKRLSLSMRTPGAKKAPRRSGGGRPRRGHTAQGTGAEGSVAGGGGDRRRTGGRRSRRGEGGERRGGEGGRGRGGPGKRARGERGRSGPGRGPGRDDRRSRDDRGDRPPRVIEQRAKREPEPEIDPDLPEAEVFRLKLERLRRKFEQGS